MTFLINQNDIVYEKDRCTNTVRMDRLTLGRFEHDLDLRGAPVTNSLADSIAEAVKDPKRGRLRALFDSTAQDERLMAVGLCGPDGRVLRRTAQFPAALSCAQARQAGFRAFARCCAAKDCCARCARRRPSLRRSLRTCARGCRTWTTNTGAPGARMRNGVRTDCAACCALNCAATRSSWCPIAKSSYDGARVQRLPLGRAHADRRGP